MRTAALLSLALVLASCDAAESDPGSCFIGQETEVEGGVTFQITSPMQGDTLRVGQPFRFTAEVVAVGDVSDTVVQLVNGGLFGPEGVLFETPLEKGTGTYIVDRTVVLDSVRTGADLSEVYVFGTGRALVNTACGGTYGGGGGNLVRVVVLD